MSGAEIAYTGYLAAQLVDQLPRVWRQRLDVTHADRQLAKCPGIG